MLSVSEARQRLLGVLKPVEVTKVDLQNAAGRVLAGGMVADMDSPPFSNSAMDGFAVKSADLALASESAPIELEVVADIPAGYPTDIELQFGQAMRIMTGAPLPKGADAVIPVEEVGLDRSGVDAPLPNSVKVFSPIETGVNLRLQGEDYAAGAMVLHGGKRLRAQDIGMLAKLGIAQVEVYRRPKVALLATGDELLPIDAPLQPGKIRDTNTYSLAALIESCGARVVPLGIAQDHYDAVKSHLDRAVEFGVDLIVSSAGVSVGAFDYVRTVVEEHGELNFWRVNMRPGKPVAFGYYRNIPFVGLPGNPVSSFVGFEVFLRPALNHLSGMINWQRLTLRAKLAQALQSDGRESYLRAVLSMDENGQLLAHLTGHQGSGNLFSLVQANGLIIVPPGVKSLPFGSEVDAWLLSQENRIDG